MGRHIAVEHAARGVLHHANHVEQAKGGGDHDTKVTRDDRLGMIAHKGLPAARAVEERMQSRRRRLEM